MGNEEKHHIENEISVAGKERLAMTDTDLRNIDARVWAKDFIDTVKVYEPIIDEGFMIGWFANAIMSGYDKGKLLKTTCPEEIEKELTDLREGLEEVIKLSRSDTCAVCNYFDDGELAQSILTYLKKNGWVKL